MYKQESLVQGSVVFTLFSNVGKKNIFKLQAKLKENAYILLMQQRLEN